MAAISIPAPGTEYGPCKEACKHIDCEANRSDAAALCSLCKDPIGFETPFYVDRFDGPPVFKHFKCAIKARKVRP
jgi:hypothetical protein